jgi:hypothetical protein
MDVVLSGQITAVLPLQQGVSQRSGQPWQSQEYVLCHEQGQYPKSVCFKVFGADKIQQFAIQQGEQLTVHLGIDCRQGQKGYFNDISCWKVERPGQQQAIPQGQVQQPMQQMPPQQMQQPQYQQAPAQPQYQQMPPQQPVPGAAPFPPQQPTAQVPQGQQQGLPF